MYDLVILGGGPAGYRAAEYAAKKGMSVCLTEKRALGGVCLNEGCIPSKTLLNSAKIYDYANGHGESYGVSVSGAKLDHAAVVERKNRVVRTLVAGIGASMKAGGVRVIYASGRILGRAEGGFSVAAGDETVAGKRLLVCTGSEAVVPPIPGLADSLREGTALTNREILDLKELPESLTVVGGGVIGLEMASYFNSAGSKVTVVEMMDKIAGPFDREISSLLQKEYEAKGVKFLLGAKVTGVSGGRVDYEREGKTESVTSEKILVAIGRRAVTSGYGLETLGPELVRGAIKTDEYMKTSVHGLYAAGDVNGKSMLAHTAYREAEAAVNNMLGQRDRMDYSAVPSVIYTNPEASCVGETEATAREKGIDFEEIKIPMNYSGRYVAENEGGRGIAKLLFEKGSRRLLGAAILANPSSEIIYGLGAMIGLELRAKDLEKVIFPHPSIGEVIREAIF